MEAIKAKQADWENLHEHTLFHQHIPDVLSVLIYWFKQYFTSSCICYHFLPFISSYEEYVPW